MRIAVTVLSALVFCCASATYAANNVKYSAPGPTQLPTTIRPLHYDLYLMPNIQDRKFGGEVSITIDVLRPTSDITLNADNLSFHKDSTRLSGIGGEMRPQELILDSPAQTARFVFSKPIAAGRYTLTLAYDGQVENRQSGLFAVDYSSGEGTATALYTQLENSDARKVFPSWDEPAYKATFTLKARVPASFLAFSNMPVASRKELGDGNSLVVFDRSPPMSTYLLFFSIGEFDRLTSTSANTEVGVVTKRGDTKKAQYALDAASDLVGMYGDYFNLPYSLPKLDNVAAPGRNPFFGAMENWGAIFTYEYAILLDPALSTQRDRQIVFTTLAHEIAHQWFGNLVTMRWWDDLWLNESFASWIASEMTQQIHPEWNVHLHALEGRDWAMVRDSIASTHPIRQPIATVQEATNAFDIITYQKGEAVVRMLEDYVGRTKWRSGVRSYVGHHAYANTTSDDLWMAMEKASDKPITAVARDFTLQAGVPMITVESQTCKNNQTTVILSQGEFSRDLPGKKPARWRVPVNLSIAGTGARDSVLVKNGGASVKIKGCGTLIVNAGQAGYYRTRYNKAAWADIQTSFAGLPAIDQLGIMNDAWAFGLSAHEPFTRVFDLMEKITLEANPAIWEKLANVLDETATYHNAGSAELEQFRGYAQTRLRPMLARLGWQPDPGETASVANLRERLVAALGNLDDAQTIAEVRRRFVARASAPAGMPTGLRRAILGVAAQHADNDTWSTLREMADAEASPLGKEQMFDLLAAPRNVELAKRALKLAIDSDLGPGNTLGMISRVAGEHPDLAFDFAMEHMAAIQGYLPNGTHHRFLISLAGRSSDMSMVGKLNRYAEAYLAKDARGDIDTAIVDISSRAATRSTRVTQMGEWLKRCACVQTPR